MISTTKIPIKSVGRDKIVQNRGKQPSDKCLIIQKLVLEEDAFVRAEMENIRQDARREFDRRRMVEFKRNLAERIRSYSSQPQLDSHLVAKSRISAARKVYSALERDGMIMRSESVDRINENGRLKGSRVREKTITPEMKSLKELIRKNGSRCEEIPSICQCRPTWKAGAAIEMCANNCPFYKNQKGRLKFEKKFF